MHLVSTELKILFSWPLFFPNMPPLLFPHLHGLPIHHSMNITLSHQLIDTFIPKWPHDKWNYSTKKYDVKITFLHQIWSNTTVSFARDEEGPVSCMLSNFVHVSFSVCLAYLRSRYIESLDADLRTETAGVLCKVGSEKFWPRAGACS
jgi:hypothetical protein